MPYVLTLVAAAVLVSVIVWCMVRRRAAIPRAEQRRLRSQWQHLAEIADPSRRVLEAEKVVDGVLQALRYSGSFADKLKVAGPRLPNEQAVWEAHKLRNRIAHEPGFSLDESQAKRAIGAF